MIRELQNISTQLTHLLKNIQDNDPNVPIEVQWDCIIEEYDAIGMYIGRKDDTDIIITDYRHSDESVLAHELLHCNLFRLGYPSICGIPYDLEIIKNIGIDISSILQHKIIYEEMDKFHLDYTYIKNYVLEEYPKLFKNVQQNDPVDVLLSLKLIDIEFTCIDSFDFINELIQDYSRLHPYNKLEFFYKRIALIVNDGHATPNEYRQIVLNTVNELDSIFNEIGYSLCLNRRLSIDYIPKKSELIMKMCDVFNFYKHENREYFLWVNKKDNQCCKITKVPDDEIEFINSKLKNFY